MSNTRNLQVDIDGNPAGFDRACESAAESAKAFDRELERLARAEREQERLLQQASKATREFGKANSEAEIASRRAGLAAKEAGERSDKAQRAAAAAADRAAIAQRNAADAAGMLERGEITAAEAAQAQARAERELARASEAAVVASRQMEKAEIAQATAARAAGKEANYLAEQQRQAAKDAVLAAGLQRLASLRASGSIKEHNTLLARLRHEYGDLGTDVREMSTVATRAFGLVSRAGSSAVEGISSGLSTLAESWPALLAMIVAGIIALPVVAIAAGGAITLAIGGALAGLGILAVAKSAEVKAAFSGLASQAKTDAASWAAPFKPALIEVSNDFRNVLGQLAPYLSHIFADMAPAVERFMANLAHGLAGMGPNLDVIGAGFVKLLDAIGPQLPGLLQAVGNGIALIAEAAGNHAAEFAQLIGVIARFVNGLGQMIAWLINAGSAVNKFFGVLDMLGGKPKAAATGLDAVASSSSSSSAAMGALGVSTTTTYTAMQLASMSAADLKAKLDSLSGKALSARDAAAAYATSIFAMNKALHDNGSAHGFATAKGVANEQALTALAKAANANSVAMRDDGQSAKSVAGFMEGARLRIVAAAEKMGYSRGEAEKLASKLLAVAASANKIPATKRMRVTADVSSAEAAILHMRALAGQPLPAAHFAGGGYVGKGYATGGMVHGYATAGYVSGPGTGTSDSIPARLSNGEYVVNAASTRKYREILDFINYHTASKSGGGGGGKGIKEATSGPKIVEATASLIGEATGYPSRPTPRMPVRRGLQSYGGASSGITHVTQNTYHIQGSVWSEGELLDVVQRKANERNVRNPGQLTFGGR